MITYQDNNLLTYEEWRLKRKDSVGSSSVGTVVFGSPYKSNIEVFYDKVAGEKDTVENFRMWLGKKTEPTTADCWRYFEGDETSIPINHKKGKIIKEGINRNVTIFNTDYPGRSSTPDIFIQPFGVYKGRGEGFLEMKNTQSWIIKSYKDGFNPDNLVQVCDQMMLGAVEYGELFYFIDNLHCEGYNVERKKTKNIEEMILTHMAPFWSNVLKARPLYNQMYEAKRTYNMKLAAELEMEIGRLEPPVQNSIGYLNYITQRYKDRVAGVGLIKGTEEQLSLAKKHKELGQKIDKLEKQQRQLEIELKLAIGNNNALDFGRNGLVTWYANKNNARTFKNNIK